MLLQVFLILSLVAGAVTSFNYQFKSIGRVSKRAQIKSAIMSNKKYLISAMKSDDLWVKTIAFSGNGSAFNCIKNPVVACNSNNKFQLIDAAGTPLTAAVNQDPGFTYSGEVCVGFDGINGNKDCPIGVTLTFERVCSANCNNPLMKVFIEFEHKMPTYNLSFNMEKFNTEFIRSPFSQNIVAYDAIYSTDPGFDIQPGGVGTTTFRKYDISETFNIEEGGVIVITGSSEILMQPNGAFEAEKISTHSSQLVLIINGIEVAASKSTTITNSLPGVGHKSKRSRYVTWSQKVSKGPITLELKMVGWSSFLDATDPATVSPKINFTNLAYTVFK